MLQKPRTVTKTEMIEKSVPVEREVMVEQPYTEHVEVRAPLSLPASAPGSAIGMCSSALSWATFGSIRPIDDAAAI